MKIANKKLVLDVLNNLEVIETSGGDEAYILVEHNEKNHKLLNEVGISNETIYKYSDGETFCILSLAFNEGYCDLYENGELIAFDKSIEVEVEEGTSIILYKHDGKYYLALSKDDGRVTTSKLTNEQLQRIKSVIS